MNCPHCDAEFPVPDEWDGPCPGCGRNIGTVFGVCNCPVHGVFTVTARGVDLELEKGCPVCRGIIQPADRAPSVFEQAEINLRN